MSLRLALVIDGNASGAQAATDAAAAGVAKVDRASGTASRGTRQLSQGLNETATSARAAAAGLEAQRVAAERAAAAASANGRAIQAQSVNTANLAAQFQDIAVSSAMGMSALQVGLQQGTQIAAAFGTMGVAGAVRSVGTALASLVSPVSIASIAFTVLAATGIQALGSIMNSAENATDRLAAHRDMLDELLLGYDDVAKAAKAALEEGLRRSPAVLRLELEAELSDALTNLDSSMAAVIEKQARIARGDTSGTNVFALQVAEWQQQLESGALSLDDLIFKLKTVQLDPNAASQVRAFANEMLNAAIEAQQADAQVASLNASLDALDREVNIRITLTQQFSEGLTDLGDLDMGRSRFDVARKELDERSTALAKVASDYGELKALAAEYQRISASIDAAEAAANAKRGGRANGGGSSARVSDFERELAALRERTAAQQLENSVVGQSVFVVERARAALELENAARKDAVGLSAERRAQIEAESQAYALAAARQDEMRKAQQMLDEQLSFGRSTLAGFFTDLRKGLSDGSVGWDDLGGAAAGALDKIADRALTMAANGIFDMIFGAFSGGMGGGGGGIGSFISGLFGGGGGGGLRLGYQAGVLHGGGAVSAPSMSRAVPAALFDTAPRYHGGGVLKPGERPIIAMDGEEIGWPDQLARKYGGGFTYAPVSNFYGDWGGNRAVFKAMLDERDRRNAENLPLALAEQRRRAMGGQ